MFGVQLGVTNSGGTFFFFWREEGGGGLVEICIGIVSTEDPTPFT